MYDRPGLGGASFYDWVRESTPKWSDSEAALNKDIQGFSPFDGLPSTEPMGELDSDLSIEEKIQKRKRAFDNAIEKSWLPFQQGRSIRDFKSSTGERLTGGLLKNAKLYPHQEEAIKGMIEIEKENGGVLLCDEMGLGKTLEAIGLMAWAPVNRTLVVVPASMATTWHNALLHHLPTMKVITHLENRKRNEWDWPWNIVVTTYDIAKAEVREGQAFHGDLDKVLLADRNGKKSDIMSVDRSYAPVVSTKWGRVIFDEAHRLRNNDTRVRKMALALQSKSKVLLTGTPFHNQHWDLHAYFEILGVQPWACKDRFKTVFMDRGLTHGWHPTELNLNRAAILSITLRGIMIRRTREDYFDGEVIVRTPGSSDQRLLNRSITQAERSAQLITQYFWDQQRYDSPAYKNPLSDYSRADLLRVFTECRLGAVHEACPGAYSSLPICKIEFVALEDDQDEGALVETALDEEEGMKVQTSRSQFKARRQLDWRSSSKLQQAVELAKDALTSGSKILFFSEFLSAVDALAGALTDSSIEFAEFNGTMDREERKAIIDCFENNEHSADVLLLTAAGGEGITLVKASVVVILTPSWNPFVDLQMKYRADRIGQTKFVRTYRLINNESFELYVERKQKMKINSSRWMIQRDFVDSSLERVYEWTEEDLLKKIKQIGS